MINTVYKPLAPQFRVRTAKICGFILLGLMVTAVLAPFIANDKPLMAVVNGNICFPVFSNQNYVEIPNPVTTKQEKLFFGDIRFFRHESVTLINPLIPYAPFKSDLMNSGYAAPLSKQYARFDGEVVELRGLKKHLLGTGKRGDDVLAGMLHATRVSLMVGIFSMLIAGFIGILLGSVAGYTGDHMVKAGRAKFYGAIAGIVPAWFYAFHIRYFILTDSLSGHAFSFAGHLFISIILFIAVIIIFYKAAGLLDRWKWFSNKVTIPLDAWISRLIEVLISLPRIILIITIAAISKPSVFNLILIIGLTSWTEIARLTRAEILRIKSLGYIESARSVGLREMRILLRHALPNALSPALVAIAFGIASAILAESALSFLGIGVPHNTVTWGSLLASGRENFDAWWLVVFPGIAIFVTVTCFNLIGDGIRNRFDPKSRI